MTSFIEPQPPESPQSTPPYPGNLGNDQFWVWGVFYVNRNDPRLLVPKRSGLGWTFNFAHAIAWWLTGGILAFTGLMIALGLLLPHLVR